MKARPLGALADGTEYYAPIGELVYDGMTAWSAICAGVRCGTLSGHHPNGDRALEIDTWHRWVATHLCACAGTPD